MHLIALNTLHKLTLGCLAAVAFAGPRAYAGTIPDIDRSYCFDDVCLGDPISKFKKNKGVNGFSGAAFNLLVQSPRPLCADVTKGGMLSVVVKSSSGADIALSFAAVPEHAAGEDLVVVSLEIVSSGISATQLIEFGNQMKTKHGMVPVGSRMWDLALEQKTPGYLYGFVYKRMTDGRVKIGIHSKDVFNRNKALQEQPACTKGVLPKI